MKKVLLVREREYDTSGPETKCYFRIRGEYVEASIESEIEAYISVSDDGRREKYPDCPDCGGENTIIWAEAGHVPGTRECVICGSMFADTRYSAHGSFRD